MTCQPGYHQHTGADGQTMLACHPISQKHTNANTRRAHQSALQNNPSSTRGDVSRISQAPTVQSDKRKVKKPDEGYEKSNVAGNVFGLSDIESKKRQYARRFATLSHSDSKHLPLVAMWYSMGQIARVYDLFQNIKNKRLAQKLQTGYLKGWQNIDSIITGDEEDEIDTPEKADAVKHKVLKRYKELKANPASQKKNTSEYAELKVYSDYLKYIDELLKHNSRRKRVSETIRSVEAQKRTRAKTKKHTK